MSNNIDERVVEMRFDNAAFQKGIDTSMKSLTELDKGLAKTDGTKAFDGVGAAAEGVASKFSIMQIAGVTALATLVNKAVDAGVRIAKSLAIDPIGQGWDDYNLKLTSVQTIMNATGKSIDVVNGYFDELDNYADKTIYNLSDMTSAFAKFTNAGIKMDQSVPAIKGIANAVALAGQDAGAAQIAFYNLSQSIAGGFLTTTDYKSLNLANVATKELKDYLVKTAVAMGTLKKTGKDAYKIIGKEAKGAFSTAALFNGQLSEGWATSKVLIKTFGDFGDITTKIGKKALAAAQNVKSLPMMLDTLKAAVGTSWTKSFEIIFGDVTKSTKMFTRLTIQVQTFLDVFNDQRNNILQGWADKGGRQEFLKGINNIMNTVLMVTKVLKNAFQAVFPNRKTIDGLVSLTEGFQRFTKAVHDFIARNETTIQNTFIGILSVLKLVGSIISTIFKTIWAVVKPIFSIFKFSGDGAEKMSKSFADWAQSMLVAYQNSKFLKLVAERAQQVGEFLAKYIGKGVEWLQKGADGLKAFFAGFKDNGTSEKFNGTLERLNEAGVKFGLWLRKQKKFLDKAIGWFTGFRTAFATMISKIVGNLNFLKKNEDGLNFFDRVKEAFAKLKEAGPEIGAAFQDVVNFFSGVWDLIVKVGTGISNTVKFIIDQFKRLVGGVDPNVAAGTLNLGLFAIGASALKSILGPGIQLLKAFEGAMNAFKAEIWSKAMLNIAIAVLVLAAALFVLSKVPADKIGDVSVIMGVMMVALVGVMKQLKALASGKDALSAKTALGMSVVLLIIGGALLLFAVAANVFARAGWEGFAMGMGALGIMVGALTLLEKAKISGPNLIKTATSMAILGVAMITLAAGIKVMSLLDVETFATGLVRIGAALIVFAAAMQLVHEGQMVKFAIAVGILAAAMMLLNLTIKQFAATDPEEFENGIKRIAIALLILVVALNAIKGELSSAAALALVIASLAGLTEVIKELGKIPLGPLATALAAIGIALGILVAAGILLTESGAFIALYAIAAVVASIGVAVLGAGLGIYYFVKAFQTLIQVGQMGAPALIESLTNLAKAMPAFANLIVGFFLNLLKQIAANIDELLKVIVSILISVMNSLGPVIDKAIDLIMDILTSLSKRVWAFFEEMLPIWAEAGTKMIAGFIQGIADNIDLVIDAATDLIVNFLDGMSESIPRIADSATDVIVEFITAIGKNIQRIIDAGVDVVANFIKGIGQNALKLITAAGETILTFLEGIESWIRTNSTRINNAGLDIADAMVDGMVSGLTSGITRITGAAQKLVSNLTDGVRKLLGINSPSKVFKEIGMFVTKGFAQGLESGDKQYVQDAWNDMRKSLSDFVHNANSDINQHKAKLKELQKDRKHNAKAIKAEEKAIASLTSERNKALATYKMMGKYLVDERNKLKKLADAYTAVSEKLEAAQDALNDAKQERLDYQSGTKDSFDDFLDVDAESKLSEFMDAMHKQLDDMQTLRNDLETVRAMGLNDKLYKQLVEGGVDSIPFLDQIINGGQDAITELNQMGKDLDIISQGIGDDASKNLYDAGVAMAEGIVAGLEAEQADLKAQMEKLADYMVNAIKKKLGIKSPSRVLAEVGKHTAQGLIDGLMASSDMVASASESVASEAVSAFEKTLGQMRDLAPEDLSINPVITPVLDLSKLSSESTKIDDMLYNKKLLVDTSAANAAVVAAAVKSGSDTSTESGTEVKSAITFVQNNNSPKELSASEIYRNTTNQLARAKGALTP